MGGKMADNDHKQEDARWRGREEGRLDRGLDAALSQYAAVEPRAGLEERVLANLRAEREHVVTRAGWRWAAAVVAIIVAASLLWRSGRPTPSTTAHHPSTTVEGSRQSAMQAADLGPGAPIRPAHRASSKRRMGRRVADPRAAVVAEPRLGQFPSRQPLSEQEKLLIRFVAEFPTEAKLVAQLRAEELRKDREKDKR
jgi:hypothetical protein